MEAVAFSPNVVANLAVWLVPAKSGTHGEVTVVAGYANDPLEGQGSQVWKPGAMPPRFSNQGVCHAYQVVSALVVSHLGPWHSC